MIQNITRILITVLFFLILPRYVYQRGRDNIIYKPEICDNTVEFLSRQCCVFPPFFTRKVAKSCGAIFSVTFVDNRANITGFRRQTIRRCSHWNCVLTRYHLITRSGYVDDKKFFIHLNKWAEMNPAFESVMKEAKTLCYQSYRMYIPLKPCEFFNFQACIRNYVNVHCPKIINTKKCTEWKRFYQKCGEFYQL